MSKSTFVIDSELARKIKRKKAREKTVHDWRVQTTAEIKDAGLLTDEFNRSNPQARLGAGLMHTAFERRLKKLPPDVVFRDHPRANEECGFKDIRAAYKPVENNLVLLGCYHRGLMPEHTIMKRKEEVVWDRSTTHIDRKDVPPQDWVPGVGFVKKDPDALTPGTQKVIIPWGVYRSGWRRILVSAVKKGFTTLTAVEKLFGSGATPEWAGNLGKRPVTTPW